MKEIFRRIGILTLLALGLTQLALAEDTETAPQVFTDVDPTHYYFDAVEWLFARGIVVGDNNGRDGTFSPDEEVNRVEALKMILGYIHLTDPKTYSLGDDSSDDFFILNDVNIGYWFADYVYEGMERGLVNGHADGYFRPDNSVNRAEAAKMISLINTEFDTNSLETADEAWYAPYMEYAEDQALLIPDEYGDYLPAQALTRGELAEMIYRFENGGFESGAEYGIASYYGDSFNGATTASGSILDTEAFVAAHKTLGFGTMVRVTNTHNNRFVDVEIVDRGPYTTGRVIDLTPAAFEEIGWLSSGVLDVRVEVLSE